MLEFNSKDLDALDFERVRGVLLGGKGGISLRKVVCLPDADILCCEHMGKQFNVKFDLDYGVSLEAVSDFSVDELEDIARILTC
ncbi:hypothetical protein [Burkholderia ambifaria]|uniref:hypothetical protein n=1 Tax=Burkholderia ambifaria TaxID=152480 RepID=UPI00158C308D|nr:hypothetical protein [Burkholderia ambifaria]